MVLPVEKDTAKDFLIDEWLVVLLCFLVFHVELINPLTVLYKQLSAAVVFLKDVENLLQKWYELHLATKPLVRNHVGS